MLCFIICLCWRSTVLFVTYACYSSKHSCEFFCNVAKLLPQTATIDAPSWSLCCMNQKKLKIPCIMSSMKCINSWHNTNRNVFTRHFLGRNCASGTDAKLHVQMSSAATTCPICTAWVMMWKAGRKKATLCTMMTNSTNTQHKTKKYLMCISVAAGSSIPLAVSQVLFAHSAAFQLLKQVHPMKHRLPTALSIMDPKVQ